MGRSYVHCAVVESEIFCCVTLNRPFEKERTYSCSIELEIEIDSYQQNLRRRLRCYVTALSSTATNYSSLGLDCGV